MPTCQGIDIVHTSKLAARARDALRARPREITYQDIAEAIDVPVRWLELFATDRVRQPDVSRVERLYEHMTGKSLDV